MKVELLKKKLIFVFGEYFSRYAHALRFAVGLQGTQTFHPIIISSGARAILCFEHVSDCKLHDKNTEDVMLFPALHVDKLIILILINIFMVAIYLQVDNI